MRDDIVKLVERVASLQGWESLDEQHPDKLLLSRKSKEAADEVSQAFHSCFSTPAGKLVIHTLIERFVLQPLTSSDDTMISVGEKGGMQKLVIRLLEEIDRGGRI